MNKNELEEFMKRHGLNDTDLADILGVTPMAIHHWLSGRRGMSLTISRLLRLFDRNPDLIREYIAS